MVGRKRRIWGWLPSKKEMASLGGLLLVLGGWWDARHHPDQRTEAGAALATSGAQADVNLEARLGRVENRVTALERMARVAKGQGTASPAPADTVKKRRMGFFYRWFWAKPNEVDLR